MGLHGMYEMQRRNPTPPRTFAVVFRYKGEDDSYGFYSLAEAEAKAAKLRSISAYTEIRIVTYPVHQYRS